MCHLDCSLIISFAESVLFLENIFLPKIKSCQESWKFVLNMCVCSRVFWVRIALFYSSNIFWAPSPLLGPVSRPSLFAPTPPLFQLLVIFLYALFLQDDVQIRIYCWADKAVRKLHWCLGDFGLYLPPWLCNDQAEDTGCCENRARWNDPLSAICCSN